MTHIELAPALASDLEELVAVRIEAMRPSLERLGRFDPARARARLVDGFDPDCTRLVLAGGECAGFLVVKAESDALLLEHLYVRPLWQGRGIGGVALGFVLREADEARRALRVTALRESDSNRFYARHGFRKVGESEWDIHYFRAPGGPATVR
jgi:GNAT superfamily N-acetyltransferase